MTDSGTYDLAIIGAGPGGYIAAIRAGQLGMRTALIEREPRLGGVCLNWGCIPSKALIKNAEMLHFLHNKAADFGLSFDNLEADWGTAVDRSQGVVERMARGVEGLMRKNGVDVLHATARFRDAHTLALEGEDGDLPEAIEAAHVIVGTGSRARLLPGMEADGERVIVSRDAVTLDRVPERLLIMGAGAIGMEFAYVFSGYGSQVTVVEMLDDVLPTEDPEAGEVVRKHFERRGVDLRTGTRVEEVETTDDGVRLTVTGPDGNEEVLEGDQVLVAIGRAPNTERVGLDAAGIALTDGGTIKVDDRLQTTAEGVYAIGDVIGAPMLAHKASHEGVQVVERLAGLDVHPMDASFIPMCVYCQPQVASVGMTEAAAREAGHDIAVSKFPFVAIGKAVAVAEREGFVKIVSDTRYGEILGATIVGADATEGIHELVLARTAELTAAEVVATVHAHPTFAEAIHEAALGVEGSPLNI